MENGQKFLARLLKLRKKLFFKLGKYQEWLLQFLEENPNFILPAHRQSQVIEFLKKNPLMIFAFHDRKTGCLGAFSSIQSRVCNLCLVRCAGKLYNSIGYGRADFTNLWPWITMLLVKISLLLLMQSTGP